MNARSMQIAFMRQLTAIHESFEFPKILDSDTIFYWINLAQKKYMKETYLSKKTAKENVEFLQKRVDDLKQLVERARLYGSSNYIISSTPVVNPITTTNYPSLQITADGGMIFNLPSDYYYYVRSSSELSGTYLQVVTPSWFNNKLIEHDELDSSILTNAINTPIIRTPLVILEGSVATTLPTITYQPNIILYLDSYSNLYNMEITYIRHPRYIVLTPDTSGTQTSQCELSEQTHEEIIELAIHMYVEEYKFKLNQKPQPDSRQDGETD
jgi:hypothetical protein